MMQIQMLSEEAEKIEQHVQMIDQQINELQEIRKSVEGIKSGKDNQEILANLGKGIFIKAEVKSKELLVNIGKDVIIKKSPEETIQIIDNQLIRLNEGKEELIARIHDIQLQVQELLGRARNSGNSKEQKKDNLGQHNCEGDCDCGEDCEGECGDDCKCKA